MRDARTPPLRPVGAAPVLLRMAAPIVSPVPVEGPGVDREIRNFAIDPHAAVRFWHAEGSAMAMVAIVLTGCGLGFAAAAVRPSWDAFLDAVSRWRFGRRGV